MILLDSLKVISHFAKESPWRLWVFKDFKVFSISNATSKYFKFPEEE